jgi:2-keto-4-pentenoate hydratase/2-oxohepta-3-ene-1,7-dioic acid hydratase in catechol pathway
VTPTKIICVGRNYVEHIFELNNEVPEDMVVFLKPNSAITEELHSFNGEQLHYEAEICFVFENDRFTAVGFGLDITKRALQNKLKGKGLPWERAKAFNGSAIFSRFVEVSKISQNLSVELDINGTIIQSSKVEKMIYKPDEILSELSTFMSLSNGDIVMTGTPKGVGSINRGQEFYGRIINDGKVITSVKWIAN